MVIRLLCLSIWMSVSILAMENDQQKPVLNAGLVELPKLRTVKDDRAEKIRANAFNDGLTVGRKEADEQIKALQEQRRSLIQSLTSNADMNEKLYDNLKQSRDQFKILENALREVTEKFHKIIIIDAEFRINPTKQVAALQDALIELKKLTS